MSLSLLDKIKHLDLQRNRVTVEAGARIQPVSFLLCHSGLKFLWACSLMVSASVVVSILCTKGLHPFGGAHSSNRSSSIQSLCCVPAACRRAQEIRPDAEQLRLH